MQPESLKLDIITWVSGLNDEKILEELYLWKLNHQEVITKREVGVVPPKRKGKLTEGYGLWADMTEDIDDFRNRIWRPERNTW